MDECGVVRKQSFPLIGFRRLTLALIGQQKDIPNQSEPRRECLKLQKCPINLSG